MYKLNFHFKNKSVSLKIALINSVLMFVVLSFLLYNGMYMKQKLKNEISTSLSDQLNYISGSVENDLQRIKSTVLLFSLNSDLVISASTISRSAKDIDRLMRVYNNLTLVTKALPYDAQTFIYFKNIDRVILSGAINNTGGFMDNSLSMDLDTFYNKIKKNYDDFSPETLNLSDINEELIIFKQFVLYLYPVGNNCYIMVKIDKNKVEKQLYISNNTIDSIVIITNSKGRLFASNRAINEDVLNAVNNTQVSSIKIHDTDYTYISREMYTNGLSYKILYSSSDLQKRIDSVNIYTYFLSGIFLFINLFVLFLNISVYRPVRKIISKYCSNENNNAGNEFEMIEKTFTDLQTRNNDFNIICNQLKGASEQNILGKLIFGYEQNGNIPEIQDLNIKFGNYVVVTSIIEDSCGYKVKNAIEKLEKQLSDECNFTKIMHDSKMDIYVIWDVEDKNAKNTIQKIYKNIDNGNMYFLAGISSIFHDVRQLNEAFRQSTEAVHEHMVDFSSVLNIFTYNAASIRKRGRLKLSIDNEHELVNYILKGNIRSAENFFDSVILDKIKDSSYGQFKGLYRYLADLRDIILQSKNVNSDQVFGDDLIDITSIYNPRFIHETIKNMYLGIAEFCIQQNGSLFEKVIKYINSNYMKDLSLTAIADEFEVTAVYLSSYFKKVSGTNLSTYLNKRRIEVALDLMKNNNNMKLNEISERVGFPNADTFTRQFKKIIGITPNKYWESL